MTVQNISTPTASHIHKGGPDEVVASGACVQAAAVLHECPPEQVAVAWGLGRGRVVDPDVGTDAAEVRARYAQRRDAEGGQQ